MFMFKATFEPLSSYIEYPVEEMEQRAVEFRQHMQRRRTVREFSSRPVPREVIEECLLTAGSAPNGANLQPWHFVVVSDPKVKREIRIAAEQEEREFYNRRAPQEWLDALSVIGTDAQKPFLEAAPCLIVIFGKNNSFLPDGRRVKSYYVNESVGIATGFLITAIHNAGLVSLTHTPSPMGFLNDILHIPPSEKPFLILVVGYPAEDAQVPVIEKKSLDEIATFI
jgi:iodotyrosine deiodinase